MSRGSRPAPRWTKKSIDAALKAIRMMLAGEIDDDGPEVEDLERAETILSRMLVAKQEAECVACWKSGRRTVLKHDARECHVCGWKRAAPRGGWATDPQEDK